MAKDRQYKDNNPIVVTIRRLPNLTWTIEPSNDFKGIMKNRVANDFTAAQSHKGESELDEWIRRRRSAVDPPFSHPGHTSVVMREGESVVFVTDPPFGFAVWVTRDSNVNLDNPPGPDVPLEDRDGNDWNGPKMALPGGTVEARVKMPVGDDGPASQRFYKFHAVIFDNGGPSWVDPDGVCDR